jgi:Protein of unknown function (DUF3106)
VPQNSVRPAYPGSQYTPPTSPRPNYKAYPPNSAPSGHLGSWLNERRNVPVQDREKMLRSDPAFNRLPQGQQQRLMQQFNNVNKMPDPQRERRLARAENLERLPAEDRMHINRSAREWTTLPQDRQAMMKNAFRDLRSVPPDQRQTVLNSSRYQNQFTSQERGILNDLLRVEPYESPR